MLPKGARREEVLQVLHDLGGLRPGVAAQVHRQTGVPEADVYGVASFYHLLSEPDAGVRVCQGLTCKLAGCDRLKADLEAQGKTASYVSCLGRCDLAPAWWEPESEPEVPVPGLTPASPDLPIDLSGEDAATYDALRVALERAGSGWWGSSKPRGSPAAVAPVSRRTSSGGRCVASRRPNATSS
jgi:hypothetical protein